MAMVLQPSRLRLTQAIYFGKLPGSGVVSIAEGNGITSTPNPIISTGTIALGPLTSSWNAGAFNINAKNTWKIFNVVEGYGADPTFGIDCTGLCQNAVNAAAAVVDSGVGAIVYFPKGHYKIGAGNGIDLTNAVGVTLMGDGPQASILDGNGTADWVISSNPAASGSLHDIRLSGLKVVNNGGATSGAAKIWNVLWFTIDNCFFQDTVGSAGALDMAGCGNGLLLNVQAYGNAGPALSLTNAALTNQACGPIQITGGEFANQTASDAPAVKIIGIATGIAFIGTMFQASAGTHKGAVTIDGDAGRATENVGTVSFIDCHGESNYNAANTSSTFVIGETTKAGTVRIEGGNYWGSGNGVNYDNYAVRVYAAKSLYVVGSAFARYAANGYNGGLIRFETTFPDLTVNDSYSINGIGTYNLIGPIYSDANTSFPANYTGDLKTRAQFSGGTTSDAYVVRVSSKSAIGPTLQLNNQHAVSNYSAIRWAGRNTDFWSLVSDTSTNGSQSWALIDELNARQPLHVVGNVDGGYVGFGHNLTPTRTIDLIGTQRWRGVAAPPVSEANSGTIYFDSATNKLRASINGSAYVDLIGSAGVTGSGTAGQLTYWTNVTTLNGTNNLYVDGPNGRLGFGVIFPAYAIDLAGDINFSTDAQVLRVAGNPALKFTGATGSLLVGESALASGTSETAIGMGAFGSNAGGGAANTVVGSGALTSATAPTSVTAVGASALAATTGDHNTALGSGAGATNTTGDKNLFIGASADAVAGNLTNAAAIGYGATVGSSNAMVLGDGNIKVGIRTSTPASVLDLNGDLATRHQDLSLANGLNSDCALPTSSWIRIVDPTAPFSVGGFINGHDGRQLTIFNTTAFQMTVVNEDLVSTAINRIDTHTGLSINCVVASFIYEDVADRWILVSYL